MNTNQVRMSCVLFTAAVSSCASAECQYPSELPGFKLCATSSWKSLRPLVSTIHDVRSLLGDPLESVDLAHHGAPYPGDIAAEQPVFTYAAGQDWQLLVYFVKTDYFARERYPKDLYDRLLSVDLVPRHRISFAAVVFPPAFKKKHVVAADAEWDEYADETGLIYSVYTSRPQNTAAGPGDLNRVSYGAPDRGR